MLHYYRLLPLFIFVAPCGLLAGLAASWQLNDQVGYTVHDDCHDCDTKTFKFYECYHDSETDLCDATLCIIDHVIYAKCEVNAPTETQHACDTTYDQDAVRVEQWKVMPPPGPLYCNDDGQGYRPVPGYPSGDCYWGGGGEGRCFLSGCSGQILGHVIRTGREVCI